MYKIINGIAAIHSSELFVHVNETHDHNLRYSEINLTVPLPQTEYLKRRAPVVQWFCLVEWFTIND